MLEPHRDTGTMGEYRTSQWTVVEHIVRVNTEGVWAAALITVEGECLPGIILSEIESMTMRFLINTTSTNLMVFVISGALVHSEVNFVLKFTILHVDKVHRVNNNY